jgi:hypothetical protein
VYTIVVLTSGDKYKKDVLITDFAPRDLNGNKVNEIAHKIIFLCPKYVNEQTPEAYREWLEAIEDSLDGEVDESHYKLAEIQKVFQHIERDDISPDEKARMIEEYHLEEAIDESVKKAKKTIIKNMLANNISMATIIEVTDLTANEIEDLLMNNDE